jgi:Mor family transcriptional regulator
VRLVRGLSLADRKASEPCETLYNMRDRIAELLQDHGMDEAISEAVAGQIIDWLRKSWGGRSLTRQWWGFVTGGLQASSIEVDGELFPMFSDPVKSRRGRELRAVVWATLVFSRSAERAIIPRPCYLATEIAALVEHEWATIYVPKGEEIDRQTRDREIYKAFDGLGNIDKMTALGVSQSTAYEVYKRVAAEKVKREQPELF